MTDRDAGSMGLYLRPTTLADALAALADCKLTTLAHEQRLAVIAGGTDVYPALTAQAAWLQPQPRDVLDISAIAELRGIRQEDGGVSFGALTTWTDISEASLPSAFHGLQRAARDVGGRQVQNRATIAGNICNASPAADGVPPLLTLDASIEIASARGRRSVPLASFIAGNRRTVLAPDELVVAVHVPAPPAGARASFQKLGARSYLVISIVSVAALVDVGPQGRIARASIAVGACSAVPRRLPELEQDLVGLPAEDALGAVTGRHLGSLQPIDDVRGSAAYRRHAALVLVRRALAECLLAAEVPG